MEGEKGRMLVGRPRTGGSFEAVLALKDPEVDPNCRQFRNSLDIDKICRSMEDFLMDEGLIHLYWGEGKGKTTAAMGLALRALGRGRRVTVVQFLKDGASGELEPLRRLGALVYAGKTCGKFAAQMTREERADTARQNTDHLRRALELPCDLLVLDEVCAAWQLDMVDRELLEAAVLKRPQGREVVLTGREPARWMAEAAHYSTEMTCHRHPYQDGVPAREGVEF